MNAAMHLARGTKVASLAAAALLFLGAAHKSSAAVLTLTGDTAHTTPDGLEGFSRTRADALNALLNDSFGGVGYDPTDPAANAPNQDIVGTSDQLNAFNGNGTLPMTIAYTFSPSTQLFFDLYAREINYHPTGTGDHLRDDGWIADFYNGDWTTVVASVPFDAPNGDNTIPNEHPIVRIQPSTAILADRIILHSGPNGATYNSGYSAFIELRGNGVPEPTGAAVLGLGATLLLRRLRRS